MVRMFIKKSSAVQVFGNSDLSAAKGRLVVFQMAKSLCRLQSSSTLLVMRLSV